MLLPCQIGDGLFRRFGLGGDPDSTGTGERNVGAIWIEDLATALPGQANRFYEGAISEHLQIGIRAIDLLRAEGDRLHSRKLRTFNEPPFR